MCYYIQQYFVGVTGVIDRRRKLARPERFEMLSIVEQQACSNSEVQAAGVAIGKWAPSGAYREPFGSHSIGL